MLHALSGELGASLSSRMFSPTPWLWEASFHGQPAKELAGAIDELRLTELPLVKAFDRYNGADRFARHGAATQWVCQGGGCASLHGHTADTTVSEVSTAVPSGSGPLASHGPAFPRLGRHGLSCPCSFYPSIHLSLYLGGDPCSRADFRTRRRRARAAAHRLG